MRDRVHNLAPRVPNAPRRRRSLRPLISVLASSIIVAVATAPGARPANAIGDGTATLAVVAQNFAVSPGGQLHLELVASGTDIASLVTALTPTTTTTPPTTIPATVPAPTVSSPGVTTPAVPATSVPATPPPPTPDPLKDISVRFQIHRPIEESSEIPTVLSDDAGPVLDILERPLQQVALAQPDGTIRLTIDEPISTAKASDASLDAAKPGVYPISIQLRRSSRTLAQTTTLFERTSPGRTSRGPVSVAMVMRIPSTPDADPVDELQRVADLAESTEAPLSIAVDPEVVVATINTHPELAARLAATLNANDVVLSAPLTPLDPSAAAAAAIGDIYRTRLEEGTAALREVLPAVSIETAATLMGDHLTAEGGELLRDNGSQLFISTQDDYVQYPNTVGSSVDTSLLSKVTLADKSTNSVAVVEPEVSSLLSVDDTTMADDAILRQAVAITAAVAVVRYESKPDVRSVVVAAPNFAPPPVRVASSALTMTHDEVDAALASVSGLIGRTNPQFLNGEVVTVTLFSEPDVSIQSRVEASNRVRLDIADVASMLPPADPQPERWTNELDEAYRTDWSDAAAQQAIAKVGTEVNTIREAVLAPEPDPLTITGRTADLPIRIESRASIPLTVQVHLTSDKLIFPNGDQLVTLTPNGITSVVVPIESRTNGLVRFSLQLNTPAGNPLTPGVEITARFTSFSGIGQLISGALVLVLLSWWLSYFRRQRTRRREDELAVAAQHHPTAARRAPDKSDETGVETSEAITSANDK